MQLLDFSEDDYILEKKMREVIPSDILKIQSKLATLQKDSRNYKKYTKILAKHIKTHTMQKRVNSHIKSIETIQNLNNI